MNIALVIIAIIILFAFYKWNTRPIIWEIGDVQNLLESVLNDTLDYKEWDYFEACKIKNPDLEKIRQESLKIYDKDSNLLASDAEPCVVKLSDLGTNIYKKLIDQCIELKGINAKNT